MKKLFLSLCFPLLVTTANASHIIGGEMSYVCLGNNNYEITLKVYRDCYNGIPDFDNPAYLTIFNGAGTEVTVLTLTLPAEDTLNVQTNCGAIIPYVCAEQAIYIYTVNLSPTPGGYTLVYQRCCRSLIIQNLLDPTNTGISITATIPDASLATCNSSPVFTNNPPFAFCVGIPINYDHSAIDPDGDSLVYELCPGISGADFFNPQPIEASAPPYADVVYASPYSGTYPFDTYPTLGIDQQTGALSGTPTSIGIFSLAVCVREYRNGNLLGVHRRELAQVYSVEGIANPSGVNEIVPDGINISPNPASSSININYSIEQNATLTFTNTYGSVVKQLTLYPYFKNRIVYVDELPAGVYLVTLDEGDKMAAKKMVVAR